MTFNEYINLITSDHRSNSEVMDFAEYAKYRWRYPFTPTEEAAFCMMSNDPTYSRSGIRKLYKEMAAHRRERMLTFFQLTKEQLIERMEQQHDLVY